MRHLLLLGLVTSVLSQEATLGPLEALKAALSEPDLDHHLVSRCLRSCHWTGFLEEASQELQDKQDHTEDGPRRYAMMPHIIWAAQGLGQIPALRAKFEQRGESERQSAQAWLELGMVRRAASGFIADYRTCFIQAGKQNPLCETSLEQILHELEREGLFDEAREVLDRWRGPLASHRLTARLAALELFNGNHANGWELAYEVLNSKKGDAASFSLILEAAFEGQQRKEAALFASKSLLLFPDDFRLMCVSAVCFEEGGIPDEAVRTFLRVLSLPGDGNRVPRKRLPGSFGFAVPDVGLPPGAEISLLCSPWHTLAYAYRGDPNRLRSSWSNDPEVRLYLPECVAEAKAFAASHINGMRQAGVPLPETELKKLLASPQGAGVSWVLTPRNKDFKMENLGSILLNEEPGNSASFACLLHWMGQSPRLARDPGAVPVLEHSARLFEQSYPELEFQTRCHLSRLPSPRQQAHQQRALILFQRLAGEVRDAALDFSHYLDPAILSWPEPDVWQTTALSALEKGRTSFPEEWDWREPTSKFSRYECAIYQLRLLATLNDAEGFATVLNDEFARKQPMNHAARYNPFGFHAQGAPLMDESSLSFPNLHLCWPSSLIERLGVFYDGKTRSSTSLPRDKSWVPLVNDPHLRMIARWRTGDAESARTEVEARITKPEATLTDWWLAAWFAWNQSDKPKEQRVIRETAERLARAAAFPAKGIARLVLDASLIYCVSALEDKSSELILEAHAAARRFCTGSVPSEYDAKNLKAAFETLGFAQEAVLIEKQPIVPHPCVPPAYFSWLPLNKTPLVEQWCRHRR